MADAHRTLQALIRHRDCRAARGWVPPLDPGLAAALAAWPEALREAWDERAAILEADAGLPRAEAERRAFAALTPRRGGRDGDFVDRKRGA